MYSRKGIPLAISVGLASVLVIAAAVLLGAPEHPYAQALSRLFLPFVSKGWPAVVPTATPAVPLTPTATPQPEGAPDPYFPYPGVTSVEYQYNPVGVVMGGALYREVANRGGAGPVNLAVRWIDTTNHCSSVFPMERDEHVMARAFFSSLRVVGYGTDKFEWTTRSAQPSDSSESVGCSITIERSTIKLVGKIEVTARNVAVEGNFAYVLGVDSLTIVDISAPSNPKAVGIYRFPGVSGLEGFRRYILEAAGNYVYAVVHSYEQKDYLRVIDVSVPSAPRLVGELPIEGHKVYDLAVGGNYVYLATDADEREYLTAGSALVVVGVSDPANPRKVAEFKPNLSGYFPKLAVRGSYAYLVDRTNVYVIDISTPANPREVARQQHSLGAGTPGAGIALAGSYAHVVGWNDRLLVYDVAVPSNLQLVATYYLSATMTYGVEAVAALANLAYLGSQRHGLFVVELGDLTVPADTPRQANIVGRYLGTLVNVHRVVLSGNYVYLAAGDSLHIVSSR